MSNTLCSHSISRRLARKLAVVTMVVLALLFAGAWVSVKMLMKEKNREEAQFRSNVVAQILALELKNGGEQACLARVRADAPMRANTRLELWRADGSVFYADAPGGAHAMAGHTYANDFDIPAPQLAGVLVAAGSRWHVRRALQPLLVEGQVQGGSLQAVGWAHREVVTTRDGRFEQDRLATCIVPTTLDAPRFDVTLVEVPYPHGPFGAKGVGELPMDGGAPAVLSAIEDAIGVHATHVPATPERILELLERAAVPAGRNA